MKSPAQVQELAEWLAATDIGLLELRTPGRGELRCRSTMRRTLSSQASTSSCAATASSQLHSMKRMRLPIGAWPSRQRSASITVPNLG